MKSLFLLISTAAISIFANGAVAKSPAEIKQIAQAITVEIKLEQRFVSGSGVIIHRQGVGGSPYLYTLITNRHVVCGGKPCNRLPPQEYYSLKLPDGQRYRVRREAIKLLGKDLDLATIQFRSNRRYSVAALSAPGSLQIDGAVYTAGFPWGSDFTLGEGSAIAVVQKRLKGDKGGYSIIYNADTLPGMSGGGVFNNEGQLVAIHGIGDRYTANTELSDDSKFNTKLGINRGIPVRWLVEALQTSGLNLVNSPIPSNVGPILEGVTADEHFIAGFNKFIDPGDHPIAGKRQAIAELGLALKLNPQYINAYFIRAIAYSQIKELSLSIQDYNRIISLRPQHNSAYHNRATLKYLLNDVAGALADLGQVIALNPNDSSAYISRGNIKKKLNDRAGALADYEQALMIDPNDVAGLLDRGIIRREMQEYAGARADYDRAIELAPQDAIAYYNRAILNAQLGVGENALADYNQAIAIDPNFSNAYTNRGSIKQGNKDFPGALADYERALSLNPQDAEAYYNRGRIRASNPKTRESAIQDFRRAAKFYRQQGNIQYLQDALDRLRELDVSE
jgi:tetratricopeptide (TPR) repeat protein